MSLVTAADLTKSGDCDAAAFELPVACDLSVFLVQLCRQRSVGAIALPSLIGFGALGVETGMWYRIKAQNQSAADAAAISLQQSPVNPALPPQFSLTSPARIGAPVVADPYARTLTHAFLTTGMPRDGQLPVDDKRKLANLPGGELYHPKPGPAHNSGKRSI
jgi:hypothetical protein